MTAPNAIKHEILEIPNVEDVIDWAVYEKCKRVICDCGLNPEYYQEALKNLAAACNL